MGTPDEFRPQNRNSEVIIDILRGEWYGYFTLTLKAENKPYQIIPAISVN